MGRTGLCGGLAAVAALTALLSTPVLSSAVARAKAGQTVRFTSSPPQAAAAGASADVSARAKSGIPVKVRARLLEVALSSAAKRGDQQPYDVEAVRARSEVQSAPQKARGREGWVYLIAMRGRFGGCRITGGGEGSRGPVEQGAGACPVLEVTVLASSLKALHSRLARSDANLRSHGRPVHLGPVKAHMAPAERA